MNLPRWRLTSSISRRYKKRTACGSHEQQMKREIAAGDLAAAEVILSCPWQAHSMSISDLLMSQKRWGRARCRRLLMSIGVPENKAVGTLTERQRVAMAATLSAKTPTVLPQHRLRALSAA